MKNSYLIMISILVIVFFTGVTSVSYATEEVKIGAIYPLTGRMGPTGVEFVRGLNLAVEIVNNKFEGIDLPLAETEGLPNLGGAKIKIIEADNEASPEKSLSAAERLISQDVVAIVGGVLSSCTSTATQASERYQIPFIAGDVSSPTLTERGFKWFWRTCPHDILFIEAFFDFLDDLKGEKGVDIQKIAIFSEDSLFGADITEITEQKAIENGYEVVSKILFPTGTPDLSSEVQKLKASNPDVLFSGTYVADQILLMKTAKELDFNVGGMLNSSGWVDSPQILGILQEDGDYTISRNIWSLDVADKKPVMAVVNKMFKDRYGSDFSGGEWVFQAAYALFIAINNAGSTENVAIQEALQNLNLSSNEILLPWPGIQFDEKGQNFKAVPLMVQVKDMAFHTIWPFELASMEVVWPMPKWSER